MTTPTTRLLHTAVRVLRSAQTTGDRLMQRSAWAQLYEALRLRRLEESCGSANARLMAAAPDLLEAARLTVLCFKRIQASNPDSVFLGDDEYEAWSALNRAIATATGVAANG